MNCIDNIRRQVQDPKNDPYAHRLSLTNIRNIKSLASFMSWLGSLASSGENIEIGRVMFSFDMPSIFSFPEPVLAITSGLGDIFLPFIAGHDGLEYTGNPAYAVNGHLALFFAQLLTADIGIFQGLNDNSENMAKVIHFLFLHSAFVKDKLSLNSMNTLWTANSRIGESEFLQFQSQCIQILGMVCLLSCGH